MLLVEIVLPEINQIWLHDGRIIPVYEEAITREFILFW